MYMYMQSCFDSGLNRNCFILQVMIHTCISLHIYSNVQVFFFLWWYSSTNRYCLMSVAGCYTDFHLDFGGTSVWYHILKGEKVFFLIPPSQTAYCRFEEWQRHGQQEKTFFPDIVENCTLVHLKEGDTLLLPSGMCS